MSNYVLCSIWNVGPGRPWDNSWNLKKIIFDNTKIEIFLDIDEKIIINNPNGIELNASSLVIEDACEIVWDMNTYGNESVHCITNYKKIGRIIHIDDTIGHHFEKVCSDYAFQMKGNFSNCEIIQK